MSKKIKIALKDIDKKEFFILEEANRNDYFSLNDLNEVDLSDIDKLFTREQEKEFQKRMEQERENWENQFRLSPEFDNLQKEKINLENELKNLNSNFKQKLDLELKNKIEEQKEAFFKEKEQINKNNSDLIVELKTQKKELELQISSIKDSLKEKELQLKENFHNDLENKLKIQKLELDKEKDSEISNQKINYENQIAQLERSKTSNVKLIGENLENWIRQEYDSSFGTLEDSELKKANQIIDGTKPDFIYTLYDNSDNNSDKTILSTITIEAKSQDPNSSNNKKNSDFFDKLNRDRNKNGTEFALLVSELETDNNFAILKINNYDNMYVVRPIFFIPFISLVRTIGIKRKQINKQIQIFRDKQDIIDEFEKEKNLILNNSLKNINSKLEDIVKKAESIKKSASDILDDAKVVLETHIFTIQNKIENFSILKPKKLNKIEEISKQEEINKIKIEKID